MKSLQDKYNLIKEGKGNKELFLKEARTMFPNVVTNVLTFDQAIHNLSERGIISEALMFGGIAQPKTPDWFKIFNENVKAELKETDKEVEEMETKGYDYKDTKNNNNISTAEILTGYYAEMKDPKNADKTETEIKAIVFKNLEKDPLHYVKTGQFGVKDLGYTDEAPGLGKPKEVTGKYKSSGMEPVKLNESLEEAKDEHWVAERPNGKIDKHFSSRKEALAWVHKNDPDGMVDYNIRKVEESLKEGYGDSLEDAMKRAHDYSLEGYVQHVQDNGDGTFSVSDWYDSDTTVVSYEAGDKFNDRTRDYRTDYMERRSEFRESLKENEEEMYVVYSYSNGEEDKKDLYEKGLTLRNAKLKAGNLNIMYKDDFEIYGYMKQSDWDASHPSTLSEAKRKAVEKHLKEIEKLGEVAAVAHKIEKINEKIEELQNKLTMTEGDDVKEMVDKKAVKELQKDIKLYEKKKAFYEKMHSKLSKKAGVSNMEEEAPIMEVEEEEKPFTPPVDLDTEMAFNAMKRDVTTKLRPWPEIVKDLLKDKVPGTSK